MHNTQFKPIHSDFEYTSDNANIKMHKNNRNYKSQGLTHIFIDNRFFKKANAKVLIELTVRY
jgi:hypothetical protein